MWTLMLQRRATLSHYVTLGRSHSFTWLVETVIRDDSVVVAVAMRRGAFVFHGALGAEAVARGQDEKVASILLGEDRVEERISTRVQWIEKYKKYFRLGHINQWIA